MTPEITGTFPSYTTTWDTIEIYAFRFITHGISRVDELCSNGVAPSNFRHLSQEMHMVFRLRVGVVAESFD